MAPDLDLARKLLRDPRYPRTATYDPDWQVSLDLGCPTLWLLESLCDKLDLRPGMRVLDLGCGKAAGSIFLAKEFGVWVCAADLWVSPTENLERVRQAGLEDRILPLRAEARELPFPSTYFDAVVAVNSLWYFGTDDLYLGRHLVRLVPPGGLIGLVLPGFYREIADGYPDSVPEHLRPYWDSCALSAWHSAAWWAQHAQKTDELDVRVADNFPDREGYETYLRWERILQYPERIAEDDAGRTITFVRLVLERKMGSPRS